MTDGTPKPLPKLTDSDIARFWAKVRVRGPKQCWPWTAATIDGRGGVFSMSQGRLIRAARVAYLLHSGKDPGRKRVCHSCRTERCCNPAHLFLGTSEDSRKRKGAGRSKDAAFPRRPRRVGKSMRSV